MDLLIEMAAALVLVGATAIASVLLMNLIIFIKRKNNKG
jgi:hypothetical protein